jgi:hypothetical protein
LESKREKAVYSIVHRRVSQPVVRINDPTLKVSTTEKYHMPGFGNLRVLLGESALSTFRQIDIENVKVSITGDDHHLRRIAAHSNNTPKRTSVAVSPCALI